MATDTEIQRRVIYISPTHSHAQTHVGSGFLLEVVCLSVCTCLLYPALPAGAGGQSAFFVLCVVCNSHDSAPRLRLKDKENNFPFKGLLIGRPTFHCLAPPHSYNHTNSHRTKTQLQAATTNNRQTSRRNCVHTIWQVQRLRGCVYQSAWRAAALCVSVCVCWWVACWQAVRC